MGSVLDGYFGSYASQCVGLGRSKIPNSDRIMMGLSAEKWDAACERTIYCEDKVSYVIRLPEKTEISANTISFSRSSNNVLWVQVSRAKIRDIDDRGNQGLAPL